jgi:hypothetical protein
MPSTASGTGNAAAPAVLAPTPAADPNLCPACKKIHPGGEAATLKQLAQTPAKLAKLVKGLDAKGWKKSYGTGKWNIGQIVAHLRDCELVFGVRWRKMIAEPDATLTPFDQDRWADVTGYAKQDGRLAFETLKLLRASNLEMVKSSGKGALARGGVHGDYGAITVGQMARHLLSHDRNHLAQIEQARAGGVSGRRRSAAK